MSMESPIPMPVPEKRDYLLSGPIYDKLKFLSQFGLPALGTLYGSVALIWELPYGRQVVLTITAISVFLGVLLGYSSRSYNQSDAKYDGAVIVTGDPEQPHTLEFNAPLAELEGQGEIKLKVTNP